jgi:hypothetical protein
MSGEQPAERLQRIQSVGAQAAKPRRIQVQIVPRLGDRHSVHCKFTAAIRAQMNSSNGRE